MKRHLTISKIDIKNKQLSDKDPVTGQDINKSFEFRLNIEMVTSGNFEEYWNDKNPNRVNLLVLNAILKNMGIDPSDPVYKIDL